MDYNDIIQILKPNYIDAYFKNRCEIKDILRINEQIFHCFETETELLDFITYADCIMNKPTKIEIQKLMDQINIKPYFIELYDLVRCQINIYILLTPSSINPLFQSIETN